MGLKHAIKKQGHWESLGDINGLGHECWCLLEDIYGSIWVGTRSGVSRYDGKGFATLTTRDGLADNNIQCMFQDRDGNILMGTRNGLSRYDGLDITSFTKEDGLPGNSVQSIYQDRDGNIWIGTSDGLCRYDGSGLPDFVHVSSGNIHSVRQDMDGSIWIGTSNGLFRYEGGQTTRFDGLGDKYIYCIHQDRNGSVWIGTANGLSRYDGNDFTNLTDRDGLPGNYIHCINEDAKGNIWIGTAGSGASRYDGSGFDNFTTEDGLAHNTVFDIMVDREGNVWFACHHGGISRYSPYEISHISDEAVSEAMIRDRDGILWWGFENILSRFDGRSIDHCPLKHGIYDIFEDNSGNLWIGTDYAGALKYSKDGDFENIQNLTTRDGMAANWVIRIYEDKQGNMWFCTSKGVSRYNGSEFTHFTTHDGLGSNHVSAIFQDAMGKLWFGGWEGGGLTCYDGDVFRRYTNADGLVDDRVICITEDDENNLWIGTSTGLGCYDGKSFRNYTTEDGLLGGFVQRITQDSRGNLWIATLGSGVSRFDGRDFQVLTTEDGFPSNNVTGIIEDKNGSMIISTYRGICRYVPDYETRPLVRIDEVDADRIYREPEEITLSEDISSVRIRYHGISFRTKRIRYNCILEGYDKEWRSTWLEEVRYENLPMGEYTFKVLAINKDLVCSDAPAELRLSVIGDPRDMIISELEERVRERTKELREAKEYIDNVIRSMADTLIVTNPNGIIRTVNQATLDLLGYEESELIGKPIETILAEQELSPEELAKSGFVLSVEGEYVRNVENSYLSKDGRRIPVLFSGSVMRDDSDEMQGIVCVALDVTELKRAEAELREHRDHLEDLVQERTDEITRTVEQLQKEISGRKRMENALRESEEMYRTIFESTGTPAIMVDEDTTVSLANTEFERLSGYSSQELEGKVSWTQFATKDELEKMVKYHLLRRENPDVAPASYEAKLLNRAGDIRNCILTISMIPGTEKSLVFVVDITERKEEAKRIQSAKMESLKQLVSGVAHQMNNPIGVVLSNNDVTSRTISRLSRIIGEEYPPEMEERAELLKTIEILRAMNQVDQKASKELARIVANLRRFVRLDEAEWQYTDIHESLNSVIALMETELSGRIEITRNYSDMPRIYCSPGSLNQAFMSLLKNAAEAITGKGKISISTFAKDDHIRIEISDTGKGIVKTDIARIFDPGFTTKGARVGMGLGLPICYDVIVEEHGGSIDVSSEQGKGTTFIITLARYLRRNQDMG